MTGEATTKAIGHEAQRANPALEPLAPLLGEWRTTGTHPLVPGTTFHGRTSFAWHEGGAFLLMRSEIDEPEIPSGVAVIGSDDAAGTFTMIYFDERDISRRYTVEVADGEVSWHRDEAGFAQRMVAHHRRRRHPARRAGDDVPRRRRVGGRPAAHLRAHRLVGPAHGIAGQSLRLPPGHGRIFAMPDQTVTVLRPKGVLDVDLGEVLAGASVVIEGDVITAVTDDPTAATGADQVIDLPELTLVPGLMDMEVDLVLGGKGYGFRGHYSPKTIFHVRIRNSLERTCWRRVAGFMRRSARAFGLPRASSLPSPTIPRCSPSERVASMPASSRNCSTTCCCWMAHTFTIAITT